MGIIWQCHVMPDHAYAMHPPALGDVKEPEQKGKKVQRVSCERGVIDEKQEIAAISSSKMQKSVVARS